MTALIDKQEGQFYQNLVALARATVEQPSLDATLQNALKAAISLTQAERGSLFLLDQEGRVIRCIFQTLEMPYTQQTSAERLVMARGLAGWIADHRQPALIHDVETDPRWLTLPDQPYDARSILGMPILNSPYLLGILILIHSQQAHFTTDHLEWTQAASDYLALVIRNAQMYDAQQILVQQLYQARDAAEEANRAKSVFLANMSHELRTPLTVIIGYTEMLLEQLQEQSPDDYVLEIEKIHLSADHLLVMINDLLDFSKIEAGKMWLWPETFDVNTLMEEVVSLAQPRAAQNLNVLKSQVTSDVSCMRADRSRVRQILWNLVDNAAKFTKHGKITLKVRCEEGNGNGAWICFYIQDTGAGMVPGQVRKLFAPFSQLDDSTTRSYGGAGLGLALSRRLCQLMGGEITVKSKVGKGSVFRVRLPAYSSEKLA